MWCPVRTSKSLIYPKSEKVSSLSRSDPITVSPPFPPFVLLCVNWMPQDTFEKSGQVERPERWTYLIRGMSFRFLLFLLFCSCFRWTFDFGAFVIARRKWKWLRIDYVFIYFFFVGRREIENFMKDYFWYALLLIFVICSVQFFNVEIYERYVIINNLRHLNAI